MVSRSETASTMACATTVGASTTIHFWCVRRKMAFSICRNLNFHIRVATTLQALQCIHGTMVLTPTATSASPTNPPKRRVAPGGCMASRRCGKPPTRKSPAWRSIPRIPIATTAATAMPSWGWLTPTVATSVDCRGSMPDSIRVRNIRSNSHGDAALKSGSACNRRCSTSTTEMAILWCFAPG